MQQGEEEPVPQPPAGVQDRLHLRHGQDARQLLACLQRDGPAAVRLALADMVQERLPAAPPPLASRGPGGDRCRLFYRVLVHRGRKGERRSFSEARYAGLTAAAHHQLHAQVILVWDNLNTHVSAAMLDLIATHSDWLTVVQLPACAPDLNPAEGVWAHMKNGLGNLAASGAGQLAAIVKNRLKSIQYRPDLINGFLAQTGLTLEPEPP